MLSHVSPTQLQDMDPFEVLSCHCCRAEGEALASGSEEIGMIFWTASSPIHSRIVSTDFMVYAIRKSKQFFDKKEAGKNPDSKKPDASDDTKPARRVRNENKKNKKKKWTCFPMFWQNAMPSLRTSALEGCVGPVFWLRNYRIYDVIGYVNLSYIMLSFCLATIPSNSSEAIRQPSPGSHAHFQALRTALHFWLGTSFNSHTDTNQNRCSVRASADSNHIPCVVLLNMFGNSKLEHPWGPGCSEEKGLVAVCFPQSYLYPQNLSA